MILSQKAKQSVIDLDLSQNPVVALGNRNRGYAFTSRMTYKASNRVAIHHVYKAKCASECYRANSKYVYAFYL